MIRIDQQQPEAPEAIGTKTYRRLIEKLLKEKENHDFERRSKYISRLSKKLEKYYRNKCGYCETKVNVAGYLTVDHYRPKKKVAEDTTHPGWIRKYTRQNNLFYSIRSLTPRRNI